MQVLFAFLLIAPFSQQFERVNDLQKYAYVVALVCTALGSALLIAPTAYHRLRFRERDKEQMIQTANRLALAGTAFLALGMVSSIFLVSDVVFDLRVATVVTILVAIFFAWFWYGLPLWRRAERGR